MDNIIIYHYNGNLMMNKMVVDFVLTCGCCATNESIQEFLLLRSLFELHWYASKSTSKIFIIIHIF